MACLLSHHASSSCASILCCFLLLLLGWRDSCTKQMPPEGGGGGGGRQWERAASTSLCGKAFFFISMWFLWKGVAGVPLFSNFGCLVTGAEAAPHSCRRLPFRRVDAAAYRLLPLMPSSLAFATPPSLHRQLREGPPRLGANSMGNRGRHGGTRAADALPAHAPPRSAPWRFLHTYTRRRELKQ